MKTNIVKLVVLLVYGIGLTPVQAQQSVCSSGGNTPGSGGSIAYTVGQVLCATTTGAAGSVEAGVQQPFEISVVGIAHDQGNIVLFTAYPNPTIGMLYIKTGKHGAAGLSYQLCDTGGKILNEIIPVDDETSIDMRDLGSSCYFLKVSEGGIVIKIFKIIKN